MTCWLQLTILIFCVSTYFVLMGLLTFYTTYKEKGIFAVAIAKDGPKKNVRWEASSFLRKYDDKYILSLSVRDPKTGNERSTSVKKSVANFIDVDGYVVQEIVDAEVTKLHNNLLSEKKEK